MSTDYAIHSDFLVHWTGKDLDTQYDSDWAASDKSTIDSDCALSRAYVDRLCNILKYGFWLTEEPDIRVALGPTQITIPSTPKTCFTELKLSESRIHAKRYGRLGIGVKRPYLFNRFGRPLAYFGFNTDSQNDVFLKACANDLKDKRLLNFFKPMNSGRTLNYDLFAESEWRILYFEELVQRGQLIDPRNTSNTEEHAFFNTLSTSEQARLKYLAPLDGWCTLIIYPSLTVKNKAQQEDSAKIRAEIARIKSDREDHGNMVEGGNWPMEVDLDACRNF